MCDFKPGDEVVCVDGSLVYQGKRPVTEGAIYTVERVVPPGGGYSNDGWALRLVGVFYGPLKDDQGLLARRFRKVERRNDSLSIEAFLTIKPGFEEPRRTPAKKRERV